VEDFGTVAEWLKDDPEAVFRRRDTGGRTLADIAADAKVVSQAMGMNAHKGTPALHRLVVDASRVPALLEALGKISTACESKELRNGSPAELVAKLRATLDRVWQTATDARKAH
jgi:hypothetical protein